MFLLDVTADGRFKFAGFNPAEEKAVCLSSAEVSGRFVKDVFAADLARKITATIAVVWKRVRSSNTTTNLICLVDAGTSTRISSQCEILPVAFAGLSGFASTSPIGSRPKAQCAGAWTKSPT